MKANVFFVACVFDCSVTDDRINLACPNAAMVTARIYSVLTMPKTPSAGKSEKCAGVAKLLDRGVEAN